MCGVAGCGKTSILLKLAADSNSIFINNDIEPESLDYRIKFWRLDGKFKVLNSKDILFDKEQLKDLIANKEIDTIVVDDVNIYDNVQELKDYLKLLSESGKNIILGFQATKLVSDFVKQNDLFDLVCYKGRNEDLWEVLHCNNK